jgi:glycosyltransferase involved in cell wall biosynthesis
MRVLQIHTSYREPGGEDSVVRAERALLRAAGHEVVEYHAVNPTRAVATAAALAASPWNLRRQRALSAAARRFEFDVAHVHNTWFALSPAVFSSVAAAGVPVVSTLHNYRLLCANALLLRDGRPCEKCVTGSKWNAVVHRCYRGSVPASVAAAATIALHQRAATWQHNVDRFIVSTKFAGSLFEKGGLPADKFAYRAHFTSDPGQRPAPPSSSSDVLYVGRLSSEKGVDVAVAAWRRAAPPGLRLVVLGDGPLRAELERDAGDAVTFLGHVDGAEVGRRLLAARGLLFPSICYETVGMSLIEAMAAGVPVLASALGGTPEIIGPAAGWLVPAGDVDAWSTALASLVDDGAVDAASEAGRRRFLEGFSPQVGLQSLLEIYEDAMRTRGKRPCVDATAVQ